MNSFPDSDIKVASPEKRISDEEQLVALGHMQELRREFSLWLVVLLFCAGRPGKSSQVQNRIPFHATLQHVRGARLNLGVVNGRNQVYWSIACSYFPDAADLVW
jgi:hypothetical protein